MRILQVNTSDVGGGAETVARQLLEAYRRRGHWSRLAVGVKLSNDPDIVSVKVGATSREPGTVLQRMVSNPRTALARVRGSEDVHAPETWSLLDRFGGDRPDILHCHNLHGASYFDLRALVSLSRSVPTVLTMHDSWLTTGHCAHPIGCDRWAAGCGSCPDLRRYPAIRRDNTAANHKRKREIFGVAAVYLSAPCAWLLEVARRSLVAPALIESRVIPNGVDTNAFVPGDRRRARAELGLPSEARIILFVAARGAANEWKDFQTLRMAVARIAQQRGEPFTCLALGSAGPHETSGAAEFRFWEREHDLRRISLLYQAADVYVHATRADTFPLAPLEAMSCGTPVIASAVGGLAEQVRHLGIEGIPDIENVRGTSADAATGLLVPPADVTAMTNALAFVFDNPDCRDRLGRNARLDVEARFNLDSIAETWLSWYTDILDNPFGLDSAESTLEAVSARC